MLFPSNFLRPAFQVLLSFAVSSIGTLNGLGAAEKPAVPDFVAGDGLPENAAHDWNLGPTGMRGWVHCWKGESSDSRQILVTQVDEGSPADDLVQKGDVIVGVGAALLLEPRPNLRDVRVAARRARQHLARDRVVHEEGRVHHARAAPAAEAAHRQQSHL